MAGFAGLDVAGVVGTCAAANSGRQTARSDTLRRAQKGSCFTAKVYQSDPGRMETRREKRFRKAESPPNWLLGLCVADRMAIIAGQNGCDPVHHV
jgi:hypothetical protein